MYYVRAESNHRHTRYWKNTLKGKKICFKRSQLLIMTFFNGVWFEAENNLPTDRTGRQDSD